MCSKRDSNSHGHFCPKDFKSFVSTIPPFERPRAENETRTRDPNLGKVVLYQLSYFRNISKTSEEEETRTPTTQLSLPPQSSASTNSATSPTFQKTLNTVPKTGLEPARCETHAPETCASTNSATWARFQYPISKISKYERKTGLGPATPTLARLCSTN